MIHSENIHSELLNSIRGYALIRLDSRGYCLFVNEALQRILGYLPEDLVGKPYAELFPEDEIRARKPETELKIAASTGYCLTEGWRLCKNGGIRFINGTLSALFNQVGDVEGYLQVFHDFTEHRQTQETLESSLREVADIKFALDESAIVAVTNPKGKITYVNDTFCKISKYSREELLGQDHRIINSGYHPKSFFKELWETLKQGQVWKGEIRNKAKDGSFYWVDTTIVPFMKADGSPYQFVAIRKEITQMKRIETELRLLNEELEDRVHARTAELEKANQELYATLTQLRESERVRETFIAALTHDMRTPLVAQQRAVELLLLKKNQFPPKLEGLLERLSQSNVDLLNMVNKLLEIYQYEAGKVELHAEPINLFELVQACFDEVSALAEKKAIQLENQIAKDFPTFQGDAQQLKRVFTNLVGNAISHISAQSLVQIIARHSTDWVEVQVKDNGPGIEPETLPHLFERYFLVKQKRKKIGSGLGLSICKMILELHGGNIQVESQLGQGTVFTIKLPKSQSQSSLSVPEVRNDESQYV